MNDILMSTKDEYLRFQRESISEELRILEIKRLGEPFVPGEDSEIGEVAARPGNGISE